MALPKVSHEQSEAKLEEHTLKKLSWVGLDASRRFEPSYLGDEEPQ